jgi:hypothetical protein
MEESILKTINGSIELERPGADPVRCVVKRTRTTEGRAEIELRIDGYVALRFNNTTYGPGYEQVARDVAKLLLQMADNPCLLPPVNAAADAA